MFAKSTSDRYYTNGLRLLYSRPPKHLTDKKDQTLTGRYATTTGEWLCSWSSCDQTQANVGLETHGGQNMFTPQNLRRVAFNPFDRPYAGWLYVGQRTRLIHQPDDNGEATRMQSLDVSIGVVGPSAGAGTIQREWHRLIDGVDPKGWSTQLRDEPGLLLIYTSTHRAVVNSLVDTLPYWRINFGNVFTSAAVGTQIRFGRNLKGFGHFDPAPSAPMAPLATTLRDSPGAAHVMTATDSPLYAFIAVEGKAVARNVFIDGNTWRNYPATSFISRKPWVGDLTLGFSAKVSSGIRVTYGHTWRTKEFDNDRPPPPGTPRSQTQRYGVVQLHFES